MKIRVEEESDIRRALGELMERKGWNALKLATESGLQHSTIRWWITGKHAPMLKQYMQTLRALGAWIVVTDPEEGPMEYDELEPLVEDLKAAVQKRGSLRRMAIDTGMSVTAISEWRRHGQMAVSAWKVMRGLGWTVEVGMEEEENG